MSPVSCCAIQLVLNVSVPCTFVPPSRVMPQPDLEERIVFAWRYPSGVQDQGPEHRVVLFCDQPAGVAVCSLVVICNWETPGAIDDSC